MIFTPIRPLWVQDPRKVEGGIIKDKFLKALIEKILAFDELFTPRRSLLLLEQKSYTNQKLHFIKKVPNRYVVARFWTGLSLKSQCFSNSYVGKVAIDAKREL